MGKKDKDISDIINTSENDNSSIKQKLRVAVDGFYAVQTLRIQTGNRVVASFNKQMGQEPGQSQSDMEKETKKLIDSLREEYKLITDAYINKKFTTDKNGNIIGENNKTRVKSSNITKDSDGVITDTTVITIGNNDSIKKIINKMTSNNITGINNIKNITDYNLIKSYIMLQDSENLHESIITDIVKKHPLWDLFFDKVPGCGPMMAAVCISSFDIAKARHVSSFWKYAGLDPIKYEVIDKDEKGNVIGTHTVTEAVSRKHCKMGLRKAEYVNKTTNEVELKNTLGYNPWLRSKLLGVLSDCLIKAGCRAIKNEKGEVIGHNVREDAIYVQAYFDYKNRLENRIDSKDWSKLRQMRAAKRYMIKQFLRDLWVTWRELEGYEVTEPYEVAKLGMKPHKYTEYHENVAITTKRE